MTKSIFRPFLLLLLVTTLSANAATYPTGSPRSTDNDDSCDIAQLPAATLLLPYFEVDLTAQAGVGETTLFSLVNVSDKEVVARVTLWTDYAYPVLNFNVYLTGYDVQGLNLYDIIALGQIAPSRGTGFEDTGSPLGPFSNKNDAVQRDTCRNLPMQVAATYRTRMQQAFTQGTVQPLGTAFPGCNNIGGTHARAVGYATIDVVSRCGVFFPEDPEYYEQEILFDNVLTGDYQQINSAEYYAQAGPLVHIRAVPEGGNLASRAARPELYATNLERTFYGRYHHGSGKRLDARQPLPSTFAARWISGGPGAFQTHYKVWREGVAGSEASCETYSVNGEMEVAEVVRFDEDENFTAFGSVSPIEHTPRLPATSRIPITDTDTDIFPEMTGDAVAGWMYLNLDNGDDEIASQAWIVSSMRAAGLFSVDSDVVALGNGCTPEIPSSEATVVGGTPIGPAPNFNQH